VERGRFLKAHCGTVRLQRRYRRYRTRTFAAVLIQARLRGYSARQRFQQQRQAACRIQSWFRGSRERLWHRDGLAAWRLVIGWTKVYTRCARPIRVDPQEHICRELCNIGLPMQYKAQPMQVGIGKAHSQPVDHPHRSRHKYNKIMRATRAVQSAFRFHRVARIVMIQMFLRKAVLRIRARRALEAAQREEVCYSLVSTSR
jgi:hypothetical protein